MLYIIWKNLQKELNFSLNFKVQRFASEFLVWVQVNSIVYVKTPICFVKYFCKHFAYKYRNYVCSVQHQSTGCRCVLLFTCITVSWQAINGRSFAASRSISSISVTVSQMLVVWRNLHPKTQTKKMEGHPQIEVPLGCWIHLKPAQVVGSSRRQQTGVVLQNPGKAQELLSWAVSPCCCFCY